MTRTLWDRYSASWALPDTERLARLTETVEPDVTYTDPHVSLTGIADFSDYMAQFQASIPGASFQIRDVRDHHGRTLSDWNMLGADQSVIGIGTSFAELGPDGKLAHITGFFAEP